MKAAIRGMMTSVSQKATRAAQAGGRPAGFAAPAGRGGGGGAGIRAWLIQTVAAAATQPFWKKSENSRATSSEVTEKIATTATEIWMITIRMAGAPRRW